MTRFERIKNMNNKELSKFIYDFAIDFITESISGICNIDCKNSKNSCYECIEKWLTEDKEINL